MTKPIVKICYELLHVIQGVKSIFDKVTSWPQLISPWSHLPACMLLLIGLALFTPKVFLFSISLLFVNKYHYFVEVYKQMLL